MFKNLYNFNKDAWHVKFFLWIYGINPVYRFKSMCPYFWSYVLTILFLPLILVIKLFGKSGTKFMNYLHEYKNNKYNKRYKLFLIKYNNPSILTDKECFSIRYTSCWYEWAYYLKEENKENINLRARIYGKTLLEEEAKKKTIRKQTLTNIKENIIVKFIAIIVAVALILTFAYVIYQLCNFTYLNTDWERVLRVIINLGIISLIGILVILLCKYIIKPFFSYLSCLPGYTCKLCKTKLWLYIKNFFIILGEIFCVCVDMVYNIYKKQCPIIHWEDKSNNKK